MSTPVLPAQTHSSWGTGRAGDGLPAQEEDGNCLPRAGPEEALRCQPGRNKGDPAAGMGQSAGKGGRGSRAGRGA